MKRTSEVFVMLVTLAATCLARRNRGTPTGIVVDSTGAVVPGVQLTITNADAGVIYKTDSTVAGDYTDPNLPTNTYRIDLKAPGLRRAVGATSG